MEDLHWSTSWVILILVLFNPVLQSIVAWIMLLPNSSTFESLINYFSFAAWVFYGCTVSALLWLRYKKPEMKRPYKVSHDFIDSTQYPNNNKLDTLVRGRLDAGQVVKNLKF